MARVQQEEELFTIFDGSNKNNNENKDSNNNNKSCLQYL